MTPDSPNADPARPAEGGDGGTGTDADDWWDGKVDTTPAPAPPTAGEATSPEAGTAATAAAPATKSPGQDRNKWLVGGAVAVIAAVALFLVVGRDGGDDSDASTGDPTAAGGPAGGGGPGGGALGTIAAIDADAGTLQVESQDGSTVTVTVTDATAISEMVDGTADDLAEGDSVLVVAAQDDDSGAVTASQVMASSDGDLLSFGGQVRPGGGDFQPPEGGELPQGGPNGGGGDFQPPEGFDPNEQGGGGPMAITSGTIDGVDGDTLTVTTSDDETVTVTLSDDTNVLRSEELELSDLAEGDTLSVTGESDDDGVTAQSIRRNVDGANFGGFGGGAGGPGGDGDDADAGSDEGEA